MQTIAVGIGVRDPLIAPLLELTDRSCLDVLEVMIDDALHAGDKRDQYRRLGARWPLIAHGTELGILDAEGPSADYLTHIFAAAADLHVHWYSEHLAYLNGGGVALGHFAPMFDDDDSYASLADNSAQLRSGLGCPFLLENPADILGYGAATNGDSKATARRLGSGYARALQAAECGALLDLTNLVFNARNDGYPPEYFLQALDYERIVEVHLAGGRLIDGLWVDAHDDAIDVEALDLLVHVAKKAPQLRAVIVERDNHIPSLRTLLDEVEQVRSLLQRAGRA